MRRIITLYILLYVVSSAFAQYDFLFPKHNVTSNCYDFWVYTPEDYFYSQENTPVIIFLHGASLCGNNLNKVRRYGPLDAIVKGRQIPALVLVPQNPGGAWNPKKLNEMLEWTKRNYALDSTRVYVIGMSLGGYGTLDFAGTYPEKIAAAMALCGGCTLKDQSRLGELPLWIIHGTADRAVSVKQSQSVVRNIQATKNDSRLRYDWFAGTNHGALARIFYMRRTYEWLFSHCLLDKDRPVEKEISIQKSDLSHAYQDLSPAYPAPEVIDD